MDRTSQSSSHPHRSQTTWQSVVAPPLQTRGPRSSMTSINVRCWAPLRSALAALPLLLLLLALGNLHPPAYVWRFKVHETVGQDSTKYCRVLVGSQDCPLVGCQAEILIAVDLQTVSNWGRPYVCFAYDQRDPDRCNQDVNTYGGCRWSDCVIHDAYNEVSFGPFFWKNETFNIRVRDPWDQRWVAGVMGKLYASGWSSTPSGTIYISREYVLAQKTQIQVSNTERADPGQAE